MHHAAAVLFLWLVALAGAAWLAVALLRTPLTPFQSFLYFVNLLLTRILWRTAAPAHVELPAGRGAVLVSNHRSSVDPFFLQLPFLRPVHWMVAREYCEHPVFGPLLRATEVIPTRRGGIDTEATKGAIRRAAAGALVGMFPEGRLNHGDDFMLPVRPGAALVAERADAVLLPCYIEGSPYGGEVWTPFLMPARVRVRFGRAIDPRDFVTPEMAANGDERPLEASRHAALMLAVVREIARLAGRDDFEPQLAGRAWNPSDEEVRRLARARR